MTPNSNNRIEKTFPFKIFWPLYCGFIVYYLVGVSLFFVAKTNKGILDWVVPFVNYLRPMLGAIKMAFNLNLNPFSVYVVIVYATLSLVPVLVYNVYCVFYIKDIKEQLERNVQQSISSAVISKRRLLLSSFSMMFISPMAIYVTLFMGDSKTGYHASQWYLASIVSVSRMLFFLYAWIVFMVLSVFVINIVVFRFNKYDKQK
jgi:hypothetical protein